MPKINLEGRSSTPDVDIRHVDTAFDPKARQAQQDWLDYLKQRPYLDDEGNIRDPKTNAIMSLDMTDDGNQAYYDRVARETLDETSRESYSLMDLAHAARAAELDQDRTKFNDILDEITDRMARMEEKYNWSPETADSHMEKIISMIYGNQATPKAPEVPAPTSGQSRQSPPTPKAPEVPAPTSGQSRQSPPAPKAPEVPAPTLEEDNDNQAIPKTIAELEDEVKRTSSALSEFTYPSGRLSRFTSFVKETLFPNRWRRRRNALDEARRKAKEALQLAKLRDIVEGNDSSNESRGGRDFSPLKIMDYQHVMVARSQEGNLRFYLQRDGIQGTTGELETVTKSISRQEKRLGTVFDDFRNQDAVAAYPGVIGVFDGVGSAVLSGDVSKRAAQLTEALSIDREPFKKSTVSHEATAMERFFEEAQKVLRTEFDAPDYKGSSTTGVIARTFINKQNNTPMVCVGHLGDSRAYIRSADGKVRLLTNDHGHRDKIFTSMPSGETPDIVIAPIAKGDILLLVSDGVTGDSGDDLLSKADIVKTINNTINNAVRGHYDITLDDIVEALMKRSTKPDDTSVVARAFS